MNTVKISELPAASTLSSDDAIPIVQDNVTKKVSVETLKGAIDTNTTYSNATTNAAGLMSANDKSKLNGIASGANKYTLPKASSTTLGGIIVGDNLSIDNEGKLSAQAGSSVTIDPTLDSDSSNPVQNKVINAALNGKQNKLLNSNGGMALGQNAVCKMSSDDSSAGEGIAIGETSTSVSKGVALGVDAAANTGGGAVGYDTSASGGGAVGSGAGATGGGAVGRHSDAEDGGAVGYYAGTTDGFAGGKEADSGEGGAVGLNARTSDGFAGGKNAKCEANNTAIDAVQLGSGTNATAGTMQVYNYLLLDANGKIPTARLPMSFSALEYSSNNYWSGYNSNALIELHFGTTTVLMIDAQRSVDAKSGYIALNRGQSPLTKAPTSEVKVPIKSAEGKDLYVKIASGGTSVQIGRDDSDTWGASVQTIHATIIFATS